jgi:hypothetical protein
MPTPAVFVFIQQGCGACHDYMPKFERARFRHPNVTVGVYDLASNDARIQHFAETLGVRATPTTIVQTSGGTHHRHVGSLPMAQIEQLLGQAK